MPDRMVIDASVFAKWFMSLTQIEFDSIMHDDGKRIKADIHWIDLFAETTGDTTTISDLGSKANPKDDLPAESRWFSDRCRFLSGSSGKCGAQGKRT